MLGSWVGGKQNKPGFVGFKSALFISQINSEHPCPHYKINDNSGNPTTKYPHLIRLTFFFYPGKKKKACIKCPLVKYF